MLIFFSSQSKCFSHSTAVRVKLCYVGFLSAGPAEAITKERSHCQSKQRAVHSFNFSRPRKITCASYTYPPFVANIFLNVDPLPFQGGFQRNLRYHSPTLLAPFQTFSSLKSHHTHHHFILPPHLPFPLPSPSPSNYTISPSAFFSFERLSLNWVKLIVRTHRHW